MFSQEMEDLIQVTLQDGMLTDQEKAVLVKRAQKEGIDVDELDVYIQSLMQKRHQAEAAEAAENDRKSKMGDLKRCPNCGSVIKPGFAACPECGYAFTNTSGSRISSIEKLYNKLDEVELHKNGITSSAFGKAFGFDKSLGRKMTIISNFPVPNNRADLLDFLSAIMPKAKKNGPKTGEGYGHVEDLSLAYWNLFANCIMKAQISFANDDSFKPYFEKYDQEINKKGFFAKLFGK